MDLAFKLLGGEIIHNQLHLGTGQDKTFGIDLLNRVRPGDLALRDVEYFGIANFRVVELCGAFWLSRLPLTVDAVSEKGVAFEEILRKHRGNLLNIRERPSGAARRHPCQRFPLIQQSFGTIASIRES